MRITYDATGMKPNRAPTYPFFARAKLNGCLCLFVNESLYGFNLSTGQFLSKSGPFGPRYSADMFEVIRGPLVITQE